MKAKKSKAAVTPTDANERFNVLRRWWRRRSKVRRFGFEQAFVEFQDELKREGIKLCARSLYGWEVLYRGRGIDGLRDGRTKPRPSQPSPLLDLVAQVYFRRPSLAMCYRLVKLQALEQGQAMPSYTVCKRHLARLRAERAER